MYRLPMTKRHQKGWLQLVSHGMSVLAHDNVREETPQLPNVETMTSTNFDGEDWHQQAHLDLLFKLVSLVPNESA